MTSVYLIRHCEAQGNHDGTVQGISDVGITQKGQRQLDALAEEMRFSGLNRIITSPLKRAVLTAQAINIHFHLPIETDPMVTEINFGVLEQKRWEDIPRLYPKVYDDWVHAMYRLNCPGGDKMTGVYERMVQAMQRITSDYAGETIAVATHGCAIRNYLCHAIYGDIRKIYDVPWIENTGISRIDYDKQGRASVIYAGKAAHLPAGLRTVFRMNWQKSQKMK